MKDTTVRWIAHSSGTALQAIRRQRDHWEMSYKYSLPSKKKKKKASLHNSRGKYAGTHLILEIVCCFTFHNEHKPLGKCGLCSYWKARRACVSGGFYPRECCPAQWGCSREVQASLMGCFVSTLYFVGKVEKRKVQKLADESVVKRGRRVSLSLDEFSVLYKILPIPHYPYK